MPDIYYFDHAAATPVRPEIRAALPELAAEFFANQEAAHAVGFQLRTALRDAEKRVLRAWLGAAAPQEARVFWGESASALFHLLSRIPGWRGSGFAGAMEHPALFTALKTSAMPMATTAAAATALVATTHVQSEIGLVNAARPETPALWLLDTVQSAFKLPPPDELPDIAVISGHKIGAIGGAALLLLSPRAQALYRELEKLRSQDYRTGRAEPLTVMALALACELAARDREAAYAQVVAINDFLRAAIVALPPARGGAPRCTLPSSAASPYILHLLLPGYQSGVIVRMLSGAGFMVAAGSACQAESARPSAALLALGYDREMAYSGLRIAPSAATTPAAAALLVDALAAARRDY